MLIEDRHKLILWSVREGQLLEDAVEWCRQRGVEFYAINKDFPEEDINKNQSFSRKLKADVWIDDRNIGGLPEACDGKAVLVPPGNPAALAAALDAQESVS